MTQPSGKMASSPKFQMLGRNLVMQFQMVLRTARLHDASNQAMLVATEKLKDTINTAWAVLGGAVRLQFVEGVAYLNDMRVRMGAGTTDQVATLQQELDVRGLGGLTFSKPVDTASLHRFLVLLARPVENEEDLAQLRVSLETMKDLALELLGPQQYREDGEQEDLRIDRKTFSLQAYAKAIVATREFVQGVQAGGGPKVGRLPLTRVVQDLVDIATDRVNFLIKLSSIKQAHDYVYNHAANTCVLSIVLGKAFRIDRLALVDLGTSALLADIGFALLAPEWLDRKQEFTQEERAETREAMIGQLRAIVGGGAVSLSLIRRVLVACEHHLPYKDPSGQPLNTHFFSRIVAVADAFDALTTLRPWREGYTADEALQILQKESNTRFDPLVVGVLVNLVGIYPLGSAVKLDSGEIAVVYHNATSPELYDRPWVKVVRSAEGAAIKRTEIRNLAEVEGPGGRIVGVARASEVGDLDPGMAVVL